MQFRIEEDASVVDTETQHVVSHRGLVSSIQRRDQIPHMFHRVFGHRATYDRFVYETIACPEIEPDTLFPPDESTRAFLGCQMALVLTAQKGMGKSKAIRAILDSIPSKATILNITFRRVLARGVAASIPHGKTYLEEKQSTRFTPQTHRSLTILINSLWRVQGRYDILILDEWVSILEMLASDLIDPMARVRILDTLVRLMEDARLVIVADALLDEPSLRLLDETLPNDTHVRALHYTHKPHSRYTYTFHQHLDSWQKFLLECLRRGERIVVPCLTRAFALKMDTLVRQHFPRLSILTYVADSTHDMEAHMNNIQEQWKVDVLIYSPVITAGCSFEVRKHFDRCFLYAFQGTASVRSALQMTMRVRDLSRGEIHVVVTKASPTYTRISPHTGLCALAEARRRFPWRQEDSVLRFYDGLSVLQRIRDLERTSAFVSTFWDLVAQTGAVLAFVPRMSTQRIVLSSEHVCVFGRIPWKECELDPEHNNTSPHHHHAGIPRDWRVCSLDSSCWNVFAHPHGYTRAHKVGFGPYGERPALRQYHMIDAKLIPPRRWNPTRLTWDDCADENNVPSWAQGEMRALWQSTVCLVFSRALFSRLHLLGHGDRLLSFDEQKMNSLPRDECSFWSYLQKHSEATPVIAMERAWRKAEYIQRAYQIAWSDCGIRSTPVELTEDQIQDLIEAAGTGAARWARILDFWLRGHHNRRLSLHPLRPWAQRLNHFDLSCACAPPLALHSESGRVALTWLFSDPKPLTAHDLHRLCPLVELGAALWMVFEGMQTQSIATEMCIGLMDASTFVASPYHGKPRGILASIVQSSTFILPKRRVGVLMNSPHGFELFIPDGDACRVVACANWIRVRGAVEAHRITLLITQGTGIDARSQLCETKVCC